MLTRYGANITEEHTIQDITFHSPDKQAHEIATYFTETALPRYKLFLLDSQQILVIIVLQYNIHTRTLTYQSLFSELSNILCGESADTSTPTLNKQSVALPTENLDEFQLDLITDNILHGTDVPLYHSKVFTNAFQQLSCSVKVTQFVGAVRALLLRYRAGTASTVTSTFAVGLAGSKTTRLLRTEPHFSQVTLHSLADIEVETLPVIPEQEISAVEVFIDSSPEVITLCESIQVVMVRLPQAIIPPLSSSFHGLLTFVYQPALHPCIPALFAINYCDAFFEDTIERIGGHIVTLLDGWFKKPSTCVSALQLLSSREQYSLLNSWQGQIMSFPNDLVHVLFQKHAATTPNSLALIQGQRHITYGELDAISDKLAAYLIQSFSLPVGSFVGISLEPSIEMIVGILAVIKAGAAYVPIDPAFPEQRIQFMLQDATVRVLLTQISLLPTFNGILQTKFIIPLDSPEWLCHVPSAVIQKPIVKSDSIAYMIYTSGSTGQPKGVLCHHKGLSNLMHHTEATMHWSNCKSGTFWFSSSFDNSVLEIWYSICFGATLHILSQNEKLDSIRFFNYLKDNQIEAAYLPPHSVPLFRDWVRKEGINCLCIKSLLVGTEPLDQDLLISLWQLIPSLRYMQNEYGPTEACVLNTSYSIPKTSYDRLTNR